MIGRVVVEADGGSRGNPGPAAYGAVLKDAGSGAVLAEDGTAIGVATNNVAEYSGLIAGLRLAAESAPGATVEVRMDSKLVVEQMSGRWRIKHPDMVPLAAEARGLAPQGTTYTWIPRAENSHADRLVNEALDGKRAGASAAATPVEAPVEAPVEEPVTKPARALALTGGAPTTLILVRHGVTAHTSAKRFSGGLGGDNPGLSDEGRAQVRATGAWLAPIAEGVAAVLASPVRRTRESAEIVAAALEREVVVEAGFAEMEFGRWDGLTFAEVAERDQPGMDAWLGSLDVSPPGGESFRAVQERVRAGLERTLAAYAGKTVVVVSHVTPIKTLVAEALEVPLETVWRLELSPASVSVVSFYPPPEGDDRRRSSLRLYNARPPGDDAFNPATSTW